MTELSADHCRKPIRRTLTEVLLMYRPRQCFRPVGHQGKCSQDYHLQESTS